MFIGCQEVAGSQDGYRRVQSLRQPTWLDRRHYGLLLPVSPIPLLCIDYRSPVPSIKVISREL
jgi:hypothetical protein